LNFMFSHDWQSDPVLLSHLERKRNAQFYMIWARYFAPADSSVTSVQVPKKWASFFLSNLMHEDSFSWSKKFLSSDIPSALLEPETETHPFVIPRKCPDDKFLDSVIYEESADDTSVPSDLASSTPKFAVVESDLRRSKRLRDARAGFRQGPCQKKNCLMCQHKFEGPPSLSAKTIRRLGERFCNLSEEELADKALKKKKNPPGCVGSNKSGKKDKGTRNKTLQMMTTDMLILLWVGLFCRSQLRQAFWLSRPWRFYLLIVYKNLVVSGCALFRLNRYTFALPVIGFGSLPINELDPFDE
jgi:hypothetical protein